MDSMLLVIDEDAPCPMASMEMTDATPMTMPSMVRPVRSLLALRLSIASVRNFNLFIFHSPVQQMHRAMRTACHAGIMRHQDQGYAFFLIQFQKQFHDLFSGFGIQVAGGFIRQNNRRVIDQGAGDRHTLLLAA